jgi:transposase-like protein
LHFVTISSDRAFNWKIERLHENIRERTKIMRQFKSLESAKAIMKGWEIFYNFIRKHQALGCCPYEVATDLKLGTNKWLSLIEIANKN